MEANLLGLFLGFIEGFALIISPCILPILPVFLAVSLAGSKKRILGMVVGFSLFFAVLIFFSHQLAQYFGLNFNVIRNLGYLILLLLGGVMLSTYLTEKFGQITQGFTRANSIFSAMNKPQGGFCKGVLLGGLIAIIWTPCAGPILAAIIVQTVVQKTTVLSFFTLLAFALGAIIPLFIISLYGKKMMETVRFFKTHAIFCRKLLGALIIVSVVYMAFFADSVTTTTETKTGIKTSTSLINGLWHPYPEPQLQGISTWINSSALRLSDLKGKVVLIDFWTYSCINCLRSLPYVKDWYHKYHHQGFVVIGVHTPEFDFEKDPANVRAAVERDGILYPVALDNQFATWINFNNHYWPAHYLINKKGEVVYEHFGEGEYGVTENNIRFLLGINALMPAHTLSHEGTAAFSQTPETYLGYERADARLSPFLMEDKSFEYRFSSPLPANGWSLEGLWQVNSDSITAVRAPAAIKIHFSARKVFMVMGNNQPRPIKVKVFLNQVEQPSIIVDKYSIYEVLSLPKFSSGELEIRVTEPGIKMYTFTFGS